MGRGASKAGGSQSKESKIADLISKGFTRWTKNGMDRLYINPHDLGLETSNYKSGSMRSASFNGEQISNSEGHKIGSSKIYVDIPTWELHVNSSSRHKDELKKAAQKLMRKKRKK